jgi:ankyrin repeat protein
MKLAGRRCHLASQKGHPDVAELLLANHAMVDTQEAHGDTAIHLATYYGHIAVAELLIDHGVNVYSRTRSAGRPWT